MYRPCWLMGRLPSASWIFRWIKQTSAVKWAVELSILIRIQPSWKTLGLSTWAVSLAYYNSLKRYLSLAEWDCQEAVCSNPIPAVWVAKGIASSVGSNKHDRSWRNKVVPQQLYVQLFPYFLFQKNEPPFSCRCNDVRRSFHVSSTTDCCRV